MSIDSLDYTQSLDRQRQNYRNGLRATKQNSEEELKNIRERDEKIRDKMLSQYNRQKEGIEEDVKNYVDESHKDTLERLNTYRDQYRKELNKAEKYYTDDLKKERGENHQEREEISSSFKAKNKNQKDFYETMIQNKEEKYRDNVAKSNKESEDKFKDLYNRNKNFDEQNKIETDKDKNNLKRHYEDEIDYLITNNSKKELKNKLDKDRQIHDLLDDFKTRDEIKEKHYNESLEGINKKSNSRVSKMREDFNEQQGIILNENKQEKQQMYTDFRKERKEADRKFTRENEALKRNIQTKKNIEEKFGSMKVDDTKKKEERDAIKRKMASDDISKNYIDKIRKDQENYTDRMNQMKDKFVEEKIQNSVDNVKNENELKNKAKSEKKRIVDDYNIMINERESSNKDNVNRIKTENAERSIKSGTLHQKQIDKIVNNSKEALEDVKDHYQGVNRELVLKNEQERFEYTDEMKKEFVEKLDQQRQIYESKIQEKENQIESLTEKWEDKFNRLERNVAKDSQYKNYLMQEAHEKAKQEGLEKLADRERESQAKLDSIRLTFDQKLDDVERKNRKRLQQTIQKYENSLETLRVETTNKLRNTEIINRRDKMRIKQSYELLINSLIEQNEMRVENLRKEYDEREDRLKNG